MNEHEDYFRISEYDGIHILSNQIPLKLKELLVLPVLVFLPMMFWIGWFPGLVAGLVAGIGYSIYRYVASLKYMELQIEEQTGKVVRLNKYKEKTISEEIISDNYSPQNIVFEELVRSGRTKFLLKYRTHKDHDLLILKTSKDKKFLEDYFNNKITVYNNV